MKLVIAHGWDTGLHRDLNEDSYLIWQSDSPAELNGESLPLTGLASSETADAPLGLVVIADGIGGAAAGEVASKLALETVAQEIVRSAAKASWDAVIRRAVARADDALRAARQAAGNAMGTTLVGALLAGTTAYVVNVGDSRAYRVTGQDIHRITHDHSYVQYLVDSHQISEQEVRTHPQRNIITRSLGEKGHTQIDLFPIALIANQTLLLCTDGLWEMVEDDEIQEIVTTAPDLAHAAKSLVARANAHGGADNISVILVQMSEMAFQSNP